MKGQGGGAVRQGLLQLCTNPAEQGHEVIADGMHPMASQPLQVFHELSDVPLPLRAAQFDGLMNRQSLRYREVQACRRGLGGLGRDVLLRPQRSGRDVIERGDKLWRICSSVTASSGPYQRKPKAVIPRGPEAFPGPPQLSGSPPRSDHGRGTGPAPCGSPAAPASFCGP